MKRSLPTQLLLLLVMLLSLVNAFSQPRSGYGGLRDSVVVRVAVTHDGRTLAISRSSADPWQRRGQVDLYDLTTGTVKQTLNGFDGPIWSMSFSKDDRTLLTASTELRDAKIAQKGRTRTGNTVSELKFWDAQTGDFKRKVTLPDESRGSLEVAWSNNETIALIERYHIRTFESADSIQPASIFARPPMGWSMRQGVSLKLLSSETGEARVKVKGSSENYGVFQSPYGRFERPTFSPDGTLLAVIAGAEIRLWDVQTGERLEGLKAKTGQPNSVTFTPDGRSIAVSSFRVEKGVFESEITVWDVSSRVLTRKIAGRRNFVSALQFVNEGRALLIGSLEYEPNRTMGTVKMWELATNRVVSLKVNEGESISYLALLPDQRNMVLQSGQNVEVRDAATWKVRHQFETTGKYDQLTKGSRFLLSVKSVASVAFSADGSKLIGEIPEEGIKIWDPRTGGVKDLLRRDSVNDSLVAISSSGNMLATVQNDDLNILNLTNTTKQTIALEGASFVSALAISRDGEMIALAGANEITLWEHNSRRILNGHTSPIELLTFAAGAKTLFGVDEDGVVSVWDLTTGTLKSSISTGGAVTAVAVDPSGQFLATAGEDFVVTTWDVRIAKLIARFKKHEGLVNALAFDAPAKSLVSGSDDRTVVVWDFTTGRSKYVLKGHDLGVASLAFSPDGKTIASGSGNSSVVLWNTTNGKLERILR